MGYTNTFLSLWVILTLSYPYVLYQPFPIPMGYIHSTQFYSCLYLDIILVATVCM